MENYNKPYLEKYSGRSSRHRCPRCGDEHSLAYYIDGNTGLIFDEKVGRCNHESSCGYHYTPKQYFEDNPDKKNRWESNVTIGNIRLSNNTCIKKDIIDYIPFRYVKDSATFRNNFVWFLCNLFDIDTIKKAIEDYAIGSTKSLGAIFWQIDINGNVRTGKIIQYNPDTGRRIHEPGGINWIHSIMKKRHLLHKDFNLQQCLFGEHLLKFYPLKPVAIVESEKSAIIASAVFDTHIWMATGGKSQINYRKMQVLKGRDITLFPDVDGFEYWTEKANELRKAGLCIKVSDILERNATDEERENKIDIADWIITQLKHNPGKKDLSMKGRPCEDPEPEILSYFKRLNPFFEIFQKEFNLVPCFD